MAIGELDSDMNMDIRIYDLARGALHKRVTTYRGMEFSPVWSQDGERVYYVTAHAGGSISWRGADSNESGEVLPGWRAWTCFASVDT
jgi:Tol biopolymer transport system component